MPQPPRAPEAPQPTGGAGQPADLLTRFLAKLVDGILVGIVLGVIGFVIGIGTLFGATSGGITGGESFIAGAIGTIISTALLIGYYAFLESSRGQTIGKMLLNIRVVGPGGGNPTMEEALRRNAYMALGLLGIVPVLGLIGGLAQLAAVIAIAVTISNSPTNQGWHDGFAGGTWVVKTS